MTGPNERLGLVSHCWQVIRLIKMLQIDDAVVHATSFNCNITAKQACLETKTTDSLSCIHQGSLMLVAYRMENKSNLKQLIQKH